MNVNNICVVWSLAVGFLIIVELLTGTFFLLILAFGSLAGLIGALYNFSYIIQIVFSVIVSFLGLMILWLARRRKRFNLTALGGEVVLQVSHIELDLGQRLFVDRWDNGARARAEYRGACWTVRYIKINEKELMPGWFVICGIDGIVLLVCEES